MEFIFQHGKDFEAIQNNIALKYKKKGKPASMVKNKEQVRHFYYRTWHKITKYIDFDHGECATGQAWGCPQAGPASAQSAASSKPAGPAFWHFLTSHLAWGSLPCRALTDHVPSKSNQVVSKWHPVLQGSYHCFSELRFVGFHWL